MKIPLTKIFFNKEEEKAVMEVFRSGWVMQGPKVKKLEEEAASYLGVKYVVAVTSGTAALHLALLALGIKKGDEVIVPSYSFIATANCVLYVGGKPIFAEIDTDTFNIDPKDIEKKITKKTKAVIAVHQIGLPAEMDEIKKICKKYNLFLVEDAACALGAEYKGKKVGGFGDVGCLSFHPRKSITTGEGGLVTTNNKIIAQKVRSLRSHGVRIKEGREEYYILGYNYRMTDIQAAIGLAQFKKLEFILQKRIRLAKRYDKALGKISSIKTPYVHSYMRHTYQSYMIKITRPKASRDYIVNFLAKEGITTKKGIMLISKEPVYKKLFGKVLLPVSEAVWANTLILPLFPQMNKAEQDYVISAIKYALSTL